MSADQKQPNPELFFETATAYQRSAAIKAAIELDVFSAIAAGKQDAAALAEACKASQRGVRILCDYLTILGFLTKAGNLYQLTQDSAMFLDRRSPAYLGSAVEFLGSPLLLAYYADPAQLVRQGSPLPGPLGTMAPEDPIWVQFARAMAPMSGMFAQMVAGIVRFTGADTNKRRRVLDIAAGHGMYGIVLALQNPNVEVIACDWPQVLELAQANATAVGVADRWSKLPGSAFDVDLGSGYDLVLLTNFLHHFDPPTCEKLLRKLRATLLPDGQLLTVDIIPNDDRVSPRAAAAFSFTMLASTPGGDAYTFAELQQMLRNSGFANNEQHALPGGMTSVIISR